MANRGKGVEKVKRKVLIQEIQYGGFEYGRCRNSEFVSYNCLG